jgi:gliding motility-associated protein GldE
MEDLNLWFKGLLFLALLACSALFASSEVAIFGLSREEQEKLKERKDKSAHTLRRLLSASHQTLITILTGNVAVNIACASIAAIMVTEICRHYEVSQAWGIFWSIVAVTGILLVLGEITPKVIALRNPLPLALKVAIPVMVIKIILYPIVIFFTAITDVVTKLTGAHRIRLTYSTDELMTLVEAGEESGQLEETEREMISSIFEFGETLVKEIMVPRTDMKMIQLGVSLQEITEEVREWGFSRYPVFQDNLDNIVGMLYAKDLITYIRGDKSDFDLHKILRPAYFIPENKEISELLKEFQKNKVHLAIVVDEYGGTAGLVTLEDVLEEIVGEIQDEYDQEAPEYVRDSYGAIDANAKMAIKDVNEVIGSDVIPTDGDFETLGGFIYDLTGRIPVLGESSEYGAFRFTVSEVEGQRIKRIKIERKDVSS